MTPVDFESFLSQETKNFKGSNRLIEAIEYSLLSPGKRIRPQMVYAVAHALHLDHAQVHPIATSLEMIHCFTLIHDDLPCMDNDDFRRGLPTSHKKFGEATALLAGDALISMAIETFSKLSSNIAPSSFREALVYFCQMIGPDGVIGGQAEEIDLTARPSYPALIEVFKRKTGALFSAALALPAIVKGAQPVLVELLKNTGFEYGIVFQILDDLEDPDQKTATSILNYQTFDESYLNAKERLKKIQTSLKSGFSEDELTLLNGIHSLFEKKLLACQK